MGPHGPQWAPMGEKMSHKLVFGQKVHKNIRKKMREMAEKKSVRFQPNFLLYKQKNFPWGPAGPGRPQGGPGGLQGAPHGPWGPRGEFLEFRNRNFHLIH